MGNFDHYQSLHHQGISYFITSYSSCNLPLIGAEDIVTTTVPVTSSVMSLNKGSIKNRIILFQLKNII